MQSLRNSFFVTLGTAVALAGPAAAVCGWRSRNWIVGCVGGVIGAFVGIAAGPHVAAVGLGVKVPTAAIDGKEANKQFRQWWYNKCTQATPARH
eukprot:TRINITY_DN121_c0_g1_i4.p1 TRINITY_DN121_c0_g1~~TRINITY_DN121_c0_g1_i4.p1  ORF type:complete len:94 (-),score=34.32 TRINITY_DN121_c0_g1_i4:118-399(-)